jgi:glycerate dehydrogenase
MRGCILDAGSLGPNVDLAPLLETIDDWKVWHSSRPEDVAERIRDAELVLSNKVPLRRAELLAAPRLRFVGVLATGTNNVDLAAARERGLVVANARDYCTESVVQHTIGLILALARNLESYAAAVRDGEWQKSPFFCYFSKPIVELAGRNLTIVGLGHQGRRVAELAQCLGMRVRVACRPGTSEGPQDGQRLPLSELLPTTDVLSFHCALTPQTAGLLNKDNILTLKKGAIVINCARGGIVDEEALLLALERGHLGGAGIDVATIEPPNPEHPLLRMKDHRLIVTPHVAWASQRARQNLIEETVANIRAFLHDEPRNVVSD